MRDHVALLRGRNRVDGSVRLSQDAWLGWLVIIGSIPVAVVGLLFKHQIEGTFTKNLWIIATMMIVVAVLLGLAELVGKRNRSLEELGISDALAVGCAQVLALIPGSSRSGSTIMAGLFAGQTRETAARFSFLLSIPAIAASGVLELKEAVHKLPPGSYLPLVVATIVSGLVGYASIWFLLRFLRTHSTGIFIGYRLVVGGAIMFRCARRLHCQLPFDSLRRAEYRYDPHLSPTDSSRTNSLLYVISLEGHRNSSRIKTLSFSVWDSGKLSLPLFLPDPKCRVISINCKKGR